MVVFIGIVLSVVGAILSILKFLELRETNRREVRPMLQIEFENYADEPLKITISNKGLGPLRIKNLTVSTPDGDFAGFREFIAHYKFAGIRWHEFCSGLEGKVLTASDEPCVLMECGQKRGDIDSLREKLSNTVISIKYMDIYDRKMPVVSRKCDWFTK